MTGPEQKYNLPSRAVEARFFESILDHPGMALASRSGYEPEAQQLYLFCAARNEAGEEDAFAPLTKECLDSGLERIVAKLRAVTPRVLDDES